MDALRAIDAFRLSLASDENLYIVACQIYYGGSASINEIERATNLDSITTKKTVRRLYQAGMVRMPSPDKYVLTNIANRCMEAMNVDEVMHDGLLHEISGKKHYSYIKSISNYVGSSQPKYKRDVNKSLKNLRIFLSHSNSKPASDVYRRLVSQAIMPPDAPSVRVLGTEATTGRATERAVGGSNVRWKKAAVECSRSYLAQDMWLLEVANGRKANPLDDKEFSGLVFRVFDYLFSARTDDVLSAATWIGKKHSFSETLIALIADAVPTFFSAAIDAATCGALVVPTDARTQWVLSLIERSKAEQPGRVSWDETVLLTDLDGEAAGAAAQDAVRAIDRYLTSVKTGMSDEPELRSAAIRLLAFLSRPKGAAPPP